MRDPNAGAQLPGPLRHCQYCSSAMGTGTDGTWQVAAAPGGGGNWLKNPPLVTQLLSPSLEPPLWSHVG